jgi:hypothetical protein
VNPSPKKPSRVVLAVVLIAFAIGGLGVFWEVRQHKQAAPVAHATLQMQPGGASVQFPVSIDTQQAADLANWNASAVGSTDPVSVKAASIGTNDRTVFLEIFGLKPGMQLKIRYNLHTATGAELLGALTGKVGDFPPLLSTEKDPANGGKNREEQK